MLKIGNRISRGFRSGCGGMMGEMGKGKGKGNGGIEYGIWNRE